MSDESYGLKDLFVQALLKAIGKQVSHDVVVNDVICEQITSKGNRLDIVIITDEFIIGIENKIFAGLNNG